MVTLGNLCNLCAETFAHAIYHGAKNGVFSWTLNATGLAQRIIKQSAPTFKAALCYGACSGMARYAIRKVSEKAQKASEIDDYSVLYWINTGTMVTEILTRYITAYVLTNQLGVRIDMKYVHITAAVALIAGPCCTISDDTQAIYLNNNPQARKKHEKLELWGQIQKYMEVLEIDCVDYFENPNNKEREISEIHEELRKRVLQEKGGPDLEALHRESEANLEELRHEAARLLPDGVVSFLFD